MNLNWLSGEYGTFQLVRQGSERPQAPGPCHDHRMHFDFIGDDRTFDFVLQKGKTEAQVTQDLPGLL